MKTLVAIVRPPVGLSKYYTIKWSSPCTTLLRPHVSYFTFSPSNGGQLAAADGNCRPLFEGPGRLGGRAQGRAVGFGWPLHHGHYRARTYALRALIGATYRRPQ